MSRETFPDGIGGLLDALSRIQHTAASGVLFPGGQGEGSLTFKAGILTEVGGKLPEAEVPPDVRGQARDRLAAACAVPAAVSFAPFPENEPISAPAAGPNAGDLIIDLLRVADLSWVRERLGSTTARPSTNGSPPSLLPGVAMSPAEAFLLSCADGTLTLDEIVALSPVGEGDTVRAIFGLLVAGLLTLGETGPAGKPAGKKTATDAPRTGPAKKTSTKASALDDFLQRTTAGGAAPGGQAAGTPDSGGPAPGTYVCSPEQEQERARIQARFSACRGADFFGILGVEKTANEEEIRRAYYKIAKSFHPDRLRGTEFEDLFPEIESLFAATTEAYNTLTDASAREEYERQQAELAGGIPRKDLDKQSQARESYLRGRKHFEAGEFFDALKLFETACQADPSKPEYWFQLGSVQEKNPRWKKQAEQSYIKAIELNPSDPKNYLALGKLYRSGNLQRRSTEMFEKVLQWDPDNEEALEALGRKKDTEDPGVKGRIRSIFKGSRS